jgi:hypothetical protein
MAATQKIGVGRYARVTTAARTDVIGKVIDANDFGAWVEIPNWHADGFPAKWYVLWHEVERSSRDACRAAAEKRYRD